MLYFWISYESFLCVFQIVARVLIEKDAAQTEYVKLVEQLSGEKLLESAEPTAAAAREVQQTVAKETERESRRAEPRAAERVPRDRAQVDTGWRARENIRVQLERCGLATVTFSRPAKKNALTYEAHFTATSTALCWTQTAFLSTHFSFSFFSFKQS